MTTTEMAESNQQDQAAVTAVRGGDAERYRELVERHERRVFAVAWSRLGDAALAEEVTQETFIRAYRRLWLLGDGAKFSGWVSTIARRVAINFGIRHRRELNKRERWALENFNQAVPENVANESESPHSSETLRQTLAELPDAHRECLVLFYLEGKSGAEAAVALGISEAALRVRLHRARSAMREQLEEKLEGSLAKLRPTKTLVPAVMAGVLASSSAKAATAGGAVITGALAKIGLAKWLLPLGSLFSFIIFLPNLLVGSLVVRLELKNFRDQDGFRARLFRASIKWRILLLLGIAVFSLLVIPAITRLVSWGSLGLDGLHLFYLGIALFILMLLPFSLRQLAINRNPFFLANIPGALILGTGSLLIGLHLLPISAFTFFICGYVLLTLVFNRHRPVRMDYNLFLRASENLLRFTPVELAAARQSKSDLLAFARFLGTRWLVVGFRWQADGLRLCLPTSSSWDLMFNWSWKQRSCIRLGWDRQINVQLGGKDFDKLAKFRKHEDVSQSELEAQVAAAVTAAWKLFGESNFAAAERALGQEPESEVFVASPAKSGSAKLRWPLAILMGLCLFATIGLHLPGCQALLSGLRPVNLTEVEVRQFMSLVSTNPNPLVPEILINGEKGYTQKGFELDPRNALFDCLVLPETNLFTARGLDAMRSVVLRNGNLDAWQQNPKRLQLFVNSQYHRAVHEGWVSWQDLNLQPADCEAFIHTNRSLISSGALLGLGSNWDRFLSRCAAWSWVQAQHYDVMRIQNWGLWDLRFLSEVNSLDLVDREKLIQQIASVQTLSAHPPGNPPIHDWKDVRGLFFTPCFPALQDTYRSLAALEILGGLGKIDREQCIRGILRVHEGKGFFTSPSSGSYNEYHIDGSARDTIAAFESLRILGALDRVKDLDKWQFRPSRVGVAKNEITWHDIEAWVCQQRLEKILREHQANPSAPWRSLLEP